MMKKYCVSFKKNTTNKDSIVRRARQNRLNCSLCGNKKSMFIEIKGIVGSNSINLYSTVLTISEMIILK